MALRQFTIPAPAKLAALWASTMCCYVYGDYFGLYVDGTLESIGEGRIGPLGPATPGVLVGVSAMMAIPSVMIALSLPLPANIARWSNVALGSLYTAIIALTLRGAEPFYVFFGVIEMALTLTIAVIALRWPRAARPG